MTTSLMALDYITDYASTTEKALYGVSVILALSATVKLFKQEWTSQGFLSVLDIVLIILSIAASFTAFLNSIMAFYLINYLIIGWTGKFWKWMTSTPIIRKRK